MIQAGNGLGFTFKSLFPQHVLSNVRWQNLHCYIAPQPSVLRAIHFSHPACAERPDDLVRPQFCSRIQAHFFFNSASQLTTSVRGAVLVCTRSCTTRNFCPSDVTS